MKKYVFIIALIAFIGFSSFRKSPEYNPMAPYTYTYTAPSAIALGTSVTYNFINPIPYTPANVVYSIAASGVNLNIGVTGMTTTGITFAPTAIIPAGTTIRFTTVPPNKQ